MKKILAILVACIASPAFSMDDNSKSSCADHIQSGVQEILEKNAICSSHQDCSQKQIYFFSRGSNMFFQIYGITNKSAIKEIMSMASFKRFEPESECEKVELTVELYYKTRQEEGYSSGLFRKPDLELHVEER